MASIPLKLGSALVMYALAIGASTSAGAATYSLSRINALPVRGATARHQVKAAAVSTFTPLYSFLGGNDGASPAGQLLEDLQGDLYGITQSGGANGDGTVYKYSGGVLTTLHSFAGTDGAGPAGGLVNSIGNLNLGGKVYGVTQGGGYRNNGVVYSVDSATGAFTVLHAFHGGNGGGVPYGHLTFFTDGNLYGTTSEGGGHGLGSIFRITPNGVFTMLDCFNGRNGATPVGGLSASFNGLSINGALFGVTTAGGSYGAGTVYSITPQGKIINLHSFNPTTDGSSPNAELIPDDSGNLYGTTVSGGSGAAGTIFEITAAGKFATLYSFPTDPVTGLNPNGTFPLARLAATLNGKLYGSTAFGGSGGGGVLFEFANGTFTLLHSFSGTDPAGSTPIGQLLVSPDGNIYGTASGGGVGSYGTLFAFPFTQ